MVTLETVSREAPWKWIQAAIDDILAAPFISLGYGAVFTGVGLAVTLGLWTLGMGSLVPVFAGGFALVAPVFAVGIYRISQIREAGGTPKIFDFWSISGSKLTQLATLSILLMVFFLTWARIAQMLFAMMSHGASFRLDEALPFLFTDPAGVTLLVIGTALGGVFALIAFAISALSFPMMVDQDVDVVTAMVASVKAVIEQPMVMLIWAWLIGFVTAAGLALMSLGLVVTFPLIAHASWHAYKAFNPKPMPSAAEVEAAQREA